MSTTFCEVFSTMVKGKERATGIEPAFPSPPFGKTVLPIEPHNRERCLTTVVVLAYCSDQYGFNH
jgi:hypothetical protein